MKALVTTWLRGFIWSSSRVFFSFLAISLPLAAIGIMSFNSAIGGAIGAAIGIGMVCGILYVKLDL